MEITKFGHSCVLLDDGQTTLLFDPGMWSSIPDITVDGIIITHIHQDHVDIPNVKVLLERKADVRIITNSEVKAELDKHGIVSEAVEEGGSINIGTFLIEAYGNNHAVIHPDFPTFQNTGYLINETVFHPGDALVVPGKPVTTLV